MKKFGVVFLLYTIILSCAKEKVDSLRSFCYWNTTFSMDNQLADNIGVNHFYIRFFDVDWDPTSSEAKPIASINANDSLPPNYTPSIFITNKVFLNSDKPMLDSLCDRLIRRINSIGSRFIDEKYYILYRTEVISWEEWKGNIVKSGYYRDILIDCDWTEKSKDNYFYFLKQLRKKLVDKQVAVTLRLWQYQTESKAGIPPVDKCLLMCYNLQAVNNYEINNSIASLSEVKKYVRKIEYPVKIDIALPIFSWTVLFSRDKFVGILRDFSDPTNNPIEYEPLGNGRYRFRVDKVVGNYFARKGDELRVEVVGMDELNAIAEYLKANVRSKNVTFFSWNPIYIQNYGTNEIKSIYSLFSR